MIEAGHEGGNESVSLLSYSKLPIMSEAVILHMFLCQLCMSHCVFQLEAKPLHSVSNTS